jgi:hypothetical protein
MTTNHDNLPDTTKHRAKGVDWVEVLNLKQKDLSHAQIAKIMDCSRQNVDYLVKQYGQELAVVETFKKNRGDLLAAKQSQLLTALTPEKIDKMAGRDLVVSLGILQDKERLEKNQSTNNVSMFARIVMAACEDE